MKFLFFLLLLIFVVKPEEFTKDDLKKMKVKQLKEMLKIRGIECEGCIEKSHVIDKVFETQHLPILSTEDEEDEKEKEHVINEEKMENKQENTQKETNEEDVVKEKKKKPKLKKVNLEDFPDFDEETFREMEEKRKQKEKLIEELERQGFDTSNMRFGDDGLHDVINKWKKTKDKRDKKQKKKKEFSEEDIKEDNDIDIEEL